MTPYEKDLRITVDLEQDAEFLHKVNWIAQHQEWQIEDVILNLARHALGTYQDGGYNRDEMNAIVKGISID